MISVVIPVKDGGSDLDRCLSRIRAQDTGGEEVEIIVVDSGSSDGSVELAQSMGARVHEIPPQEFNHGSARNTGAGLAAGEVLVFISQDAYPVANDWLVRLAAPLRSEPEVGGVYGRQLPHEGASPPEVFFLDFLYGPAPRRQRIASAVELSMDTTLFSNVNAAMLRATWERFPFVGDIIMSEDQEWSRRVLLAGLAIVYDPEAAVRHSHDYTLGAAFRRFFDSGVSSDRAYMAGRQESGRVLRSTALRYARGELAWLAQTGQRRWIPYAVLYEGAKVAGLVLGVNHRRLPAPLRRRLSAVPSHWERTDPEAANRSAGR